MGATNPNAGGAPGGGGKGGMGQGQVRPGNGGPMGGMNPMQGFANMNKLGQGFGSAGAYGPSAGASQMPAQQGPAGAPMANWQSMMQKFPSFLGGGHGFGMPTQGHRPNMTQFGDMYKTFGSMGGGGTPMPNLDMQSGNLTPINQAIPTPQPQEPVGGYINGQPAQFHYQAEALKKPAVNNVGLPTGGILARLYGG